MSMMHLRNVLLACSIFYVVNCKHQDQGILNKVLIEAIESDFNTTDNNTKSEPLVEKCPINYLIDRFSESVVPEDYQAVNSEEDVYEPVGHLNKTMDKLDRLNTWVKNVSDKFDYVTKRITSRVAEMVMEMDINAECRNSLVRIARGIENSETWANQCE